MHINNSKNLRFAYAPISRDFASPGDRRRFCFWAKERGIKYESADPSVDYDVIILSLMSDLSQWKRYTKRGRIIFDFADPYLFVSKANFKDRMRGLAKFIFGQNKYLHLDYKKLLIDVCKKADAVICSSSEQQNEIKKYCSKTVVILDDFSELGEKKKVNYETDKSFKFFWEGMGINLDSFLCIRHALETIGYRYKISIHLVTDIEYFRYMRKIGRKACKRTIEKTFGLKDVYLYEWNSHMLASIATSCDAALIPMPLGNQYLKHKSANKLLLCWRMGLPTITSATPAYEREMKEAGLNFTCNTQNDWISMLEKIITDQELREKTGKKGYDYVESNYSKQSLLEKWDDIIYSVLEK
ncbi:MAG: hypothetical protein ABSH06_00655 [Thermodesulfobacteriota bacterium]